MAAFRDADETGVVTREDAPEVAEALVPQAKEAAKLVSQDVVVRPLPAPMPPAQRLSVIWLREARKG